MTHVKLRLFPQEPAGLNLLSQMARQIVLATGTLSEILGAPASEHARLVEDMHNHEAKSAELHFALLTHMRTSFVNPLPREDMYALSRYLNEAMEKLDAAADLVSLYKLERLPKRAADQLEIISRQAELTVDAMRQLNNLDDLEDYWIEILRLAKRAERTHRVWVADMLEDMKSAQYARNRDIAGPAGGGHQGHAADRHPGGQHHRQGILTVSVLFFALVVVFAAAFAFLNGFRDASSSVALPVRTRALTPTVAVLLAGLFNFIGAALSATLALEVSRTWVRPCRPAATA